MTDEVFFFLFGNVFLSAAAGLMVYYKTWKFFRKTRGTDGQIEQLYQSCNGNTLAMLMQASPKERREYPELSQLRNGFLIVFGYGFVCGFIVVVLGNAGL